MRRPRRTLRRRRIIVVGHLPAVVALLPVIAVGAMLAWFVLAQPAQAVPPSSLGVSPTAATVGATPPL